MGDAARIRRKARRDCQQARTTFKKAEAELEVYEKRDRPSYLRWYRAAFGPLLEELRTVHEAGEAIRDRMRRLERFVALRRCSPREAGRLLERAPEEFARIEEALLARERRRAEARLRDEQERMRRFKAEMAKAFLAFVRDQKRQVRAGLRRDIPPRTLLLDMLNFYEMDTGFPAEQAEVLLREPEGRKVLEEVGLAGALDEESGYDDDGWGEEFGAGDDIPFGAFDMEEPPRKAREQDGARIKALWRELAFALHPDQSDSGTDPRKRELWHQAQAAMAAGDLDRLEVLHAHVKFMDGEASEEVPVARLHALTRMYRESRNALRRKIRALRATMEWGFATQGEEARERVRVEQEAILRRELRAAQALVKDLRLEYARNYAPPVKATPRAGPPGMEQLRFADL